MYSTALSSDWTEGLLIGRSEVVHCEGLHLYPVSDVSDGSVATPQVSSLSSAQSTRLPQ